MFFLNIVLSLSFIKVFITNTIKTIKNIFNKDNETQSQTDSYTSSNQSINQLDDEQKILNSIDIISEGEDDDDGEEISSTNKKD